MAELIYTVSPEGELTVRAEDLTRGQWEQLTAEQRALLGDPTRQVLEEERHVHHVHTQTRGEVHPRG